MYGPQKGASPDDVRLLDAALAHWADLVDAATGRAGVRDRAGAGAAGGVGYAAMAVLGAELEPGIGLILDLVRFADHLPGASLVITGEGSLDEQTLHGKAPAGVASAAAKAGIPVVTVSGRLALDAEQLKAAGIERRLRPDRHRTRRPALRRRRRTPAGEAGPGAGPRTDRRYEPMTSVPLFVNGGGMRGGNVHYSIEGLPFLGEARTAPRYRFFSIRDEFPGLWPVAEGGVSVPGELYDVPLDVIRDRFIPAEPPELELSVIELDDGSSAVAVVLREAAHQAGTGLTDISDAGGWRAYRASRVG